MIGSEPKCLACGYVLLGLTVARCPECGAPFDPKDPQTYSTGHTVQMLRRLPPFALGTVGLFMLGAYLVIPIAVSHDVAAPLAVFLVPVPYGVVHVAFLILAYAGLGLLVLARTQSRASRYACLSTLATALLLASSLCFLALSVTF